MRDFASFNGFKRLFGFTAIVAVCLTVVMLSGCGRKCRCNSNRSGCNSCNTCQQPTSCNTCNTCNTCSVSDAAPSTTCTTCNVDRVSQAPASLSERTYVAPTATTSYSTGTNYTQTNTTLERTGDTRDLPVFSAPVAQTPPVQAAPVQVYQQPPQSAAQILPEPTRSGGQYHTLQQGETVYALSRKYGVKARTILDANHFNDPNHLSVGTKVYIPAN